MKTRSDPERKREEQNEIEVDASCSCVRDPFAALPPDMRPPAQAKKGSLREVICPGCGIKFWTNRSTD
ncbi:MAG: hypothetical protein PVH60_10095, partial [Anaerolineales bacterium]